MRILNRFALAAVAVLILAASLTPAQAVCGGNPIIQTVSATGPTSFIWNPAVCTVGYYPGYPPFCNYYAAEMPWTPAFEATFWAFGAGNPAIGPGDDAGSYTVPPATWASFGMTGYGVAGYAGTIFTGWGANAGIDGCLQNQAPGTCTCVLLTDEDGTDGYFAILGNNAAAGSWWTQLEQPGTDGAGNLGPIMLQPMAKATILNSVRNPTTFDLNLDVTVNPVPMADYTLGTCATCGPIGFKLYQMILARGSAPPAVRDIATGGWTLMQLPGPLPQPALGTALGSPVTVESICGASNTDVYIGAALVFDSGFETPVVAQNSTRVECGPNLADPEPQRFRPGSQQGPRRPTRERQR